MTAMNGVYGLPATTSEWQRRLIGSVLSVHLGLISLFTPPAKASNEPPITTAEISQLMHFIRGSGCEFRRNGTWHSPGQAVELLQKKHDYMLMWGKVPSTEYFIDEAASHSSTSGDPYHVRCQGAPQQESRHWLNDELARLRKAKR